MPVPPMMARSGERASRPFSVGENGQDARSPDDGDLGTTPRGAVGLPPHPLGVVPLRGLSVYPRTPSGSTPRGPVGLPSGVGVVVPTGPRGSGVSRRPRRSLIVSLFIFVFLSFAV